LIKSILSEHSYEIEAIKHLIRKNIKKLDLYHLIHVFELLIPKSDRKLNGAFFTPRNITKHIVNQTIKNKIQTICDPSCGCGAFLIEAAIHLHNNYGKKIISSIENNLFGVDIAEYSVRRAQILLSILSLQKGEDKKTISFNLITANSLDSDWENLFLSNLKNDGFDVVIGNPPYVKFQDLSEIVRGKLFKDWITLKKGNYNLYFAFFELGINILNKNGVLGYITPNNYFTSLSGIHLRDYLEFNRYIDKIIDFNHLKIFQSQTYTCITFLKKQKKNYFYYDRIEDSCALNNLEQIKYSEIKYSDLNNKKWRLLKKEDQNNIRIIENKGYKLGHLFDIKVGIATCKDSVYFIDANTLSNGYYKKIHRGKSYFIEQEITKPIVKISDFKNQEELENNLRRIIFPYKNVKGNIELIDENELSVAFPKCFEYLLAVKEELASRDKGKVKYPQWYAYARTQGLNFYGEKLFTPTFSSTPRFLYEKNFDTLFCNGYAIYKKQAPNLFAGHLELNILSKILNSKIMDYYIKKTSVSIEGGFPCYQKNFIELFNIPSFTDEEISFLNDEKEKVLIDNFLINKYQVHI
jgi:type I restriction-modification system DNA methylase subunit